MNASQGNPAIKAFINSIGPQGRFGQLSIIKGADEFEVRHIEDEQRPQDSVQVCSLAQLRERVATDSKQRFRPLKSAPTLRSGWRSTCAGPTELWDLLNIVYPGAVGTWYATSTNQAEPASPAVSYREFVGRQSGMYRGASQLTDLEAEEVATACCARSHCLKRRLWTIHEQSPLPTESAPQLVCLEPCQLVLELARRESKTKQEAEIRWDLRKSEAKYLLEYLNTNQSQGEPDRVADFDSTSNPRRLDLLINRLESQFTRQTKNLRE